MSILDKDMTVKELEEWMKERDMSMQVFMGCDGRFTVLVYPSDEPHKYESATSEDLPSAVIDAIGEWENTFYDQDDEDRADSAAPPGANGEDEED